MALSDRAEEILAKQLGNGRAAELRAAMDLAYNSGGSDVLNSRGRLLIANLFGRTRGEEFCAISDAAGYPTGSRVEELLLREFGSSDGLELVDAFSSAYFVAGYDSKVFAYVSSPSAASTGQFNNDTNDPINFPYNGDAAALAFMAAFVGDTDVDQDGDFVVFSLVGGGPAAHGHVYNVVGLSLRTWIPNSIVFTSLFSRDTDDVEITRIPQASFITATWNSAVHSGASSAGEFYGDQGTPTSFTINDSTGGTTFVSTLSPGDTVVIANNGSQNATAIVASTSLGSGEATFTATLEVDVSGFTDATVFTIYKQ